MSEVVTQEQYDAMKEYYRIEKGYYDDISDEDKERIDKYLDKAMSEYYEVGEPNENDETDVSDEVDEDEGSDTTESADMGGKTMSVSKEEMEQYKSDMKLNYDYDNMSDEEKEEFDNRLDQYCDEVFEVVEENEEDKVEETDHVKKLIR